MLEFHSHNTCNHEPTRRLTEAGARIVVRTFVRWLALKRMRISSLCCQKEEKSDGTRPINHHTESWRRRVKKKRGEEGGEERGGSQTFSHDRFLSTTFPGGVEEKRCDGGLAEHRGVSSAMRWQQLITSRRRGTAGGDAEPRLRDDNARHTRLRRRQLRKLLTNFLTGI